MIIERMECPEHGARNVLGRSCRAWERPYVFCTRELVTVEYVPAESAVLLTDAERERILWWLHQPVPPGPMKELDVAIIRKLNAAAAPPSSQPPKEA